MATRLLEIAEALGKLYRDKAQDELLLWKREKDLAERTTAIVPEGGWPGKNDSERKAAQLKALADDQVLKNIDELQMVTRSKIATASGEIAALEAERRAMEWEIRDQMVRAMAGHTDEAEHGVVEASGADLALDQTMLPLSEFSQDEIPF